MTLSSGDFRSYMRQLAGWVWTEQEDAFSFKFLQRALDASLFQIRHEHLERLMLHSVYFPEGVPADVEGYAQPGTIGLLLKVLANDLSQLNVGEIRADQVAATTNGFYQVH